MTYWFDVTDLINRNGRHFTGVQRVVINPLVELAKQKSNIKAFYYDKENGLCKEAYLNPFNTNLYKCLKKSNQEIIFQKQDKLVLMGATWGYRPLIDVLIQLKLEVGCKIYSFVHDITAIKVPQYHLPSFPPIFENWMKDLIMPYSEKIITNSEYSKKDILWLYNEYGFEPPDVQVVRLGDEINKDLEPIKPKQINDDSFILFVSTIEPRKNHQLIYQVWNLMLERFSDTSIIPKVYFIGGKGWNNDNFYFQFTNHPLLKYKLIHLEGINDEELSWLYKNCLFTIYPSKYEGWGLPVAESLANGKCCLASKKTSIPEIGGDLVWYINPYSTELSLQLIQSLLDDPDRLNQQNKLISKTFKTTQWCQTSRQLWSIICD